MALSAWGIRKFLLRQPKASLIRLTQGSKSEDLVPRKNQSWSRLGETIASVAPDLLECFDGDGNLLRAIRPQTDSDPNDAPEAPAVLSTDPETARLTHFANLIHRAYEHSTNVAFAKLVELVERIDARSDAIEQRLERSEAAYRRVVRDQLDDAFERADDLLEQAQGEDGGGELATLARTFLKSAAAGKSESRRSNGKG